MKQTKGLMGNELKFLVEETGGIPRESFFGNFKFLILFLIKVTMQYRFLYVTFNLINFSFI